MFTNKNEICLGMFGSTNLNSYFFLRKISERCLICDSYQGGFILIVISWRIGNAHFTYHLLLGVGYTWIQL